MVKGMKKKIIAVILSVSVAAGGVTAVVMNYRDGEFRPDAYANSRERNDNQIVFPGQDMSTLGEETSDESELWEQDKNSEEKLKPEDKPSDSLLFETTKVAAAVDQAQIPEEDANAGQDTSSEDTVYVPDTNKEDKKSDGSVGNNENVIVIPANPSGTGSGIGGNHASGEEAGSGSGVDSDHSSDTQKPSGGQKPSDGQNTSDDNGNHSGNHQPSGGNSNPSQPDKKDVDTTIPELPKEDSIYEEVFGVKPYPGDDKIDMGSKEDFTKKYSLRINRTWNAEDQKYALYMGEYLNDERVLCSLYVHVCEDGNPKYRLTELNDNFRIGAYPKQITEDHIEFTFYYRPGADYDWIEGTYDMEIPYTAKLLIRDWESGEYIEQYMVSKENSTVPLMRFYHSLVQEKSEQLAIPENKLLFRGFSETEGGEPLPQVYQNTDAGAKVLYPLEPEVLDDAYVMEWQWDNVQTGIIEDFFQMQTLTGYRGDAENLEIPEGIQSVDLNWIDLDSWEPLTTVFHTIKIPKTVLQFNLQDKDYLQITDGYEVDPDNPVYTEQDGMLFDKEKTMLLGIPTAKEVVTVPDTVTEVQIPRTNKIKELHIQSDTPVEINLEYLEGAKIYVPAESYLRYLAVWGKNPGDSEKAENVLLPDKELEEEFTEDSVGVYSADGKTLLALKSSAGGTVIVPEGVETIAASALENCGAIDRLILPVSLKALKKDSLAVNPPARAVFMGTTAPQVEEGAFAAKTELQALLSAKESYQSVWKEIPGVSVGAIHFKNYQLVIGGNADYIYLNEEACSLGDGETAGAILLKAPADCTYFDASSKPDVQWKEIAARAFAGCESLYMIELPDSVKVIGREAFAGCSALQGAISYAADTITIREEAFADDYALRFVALNAKNVDAYDYLHSTSGGAWYTVSDGQVNQLFNRFSPKYELDKTAGGILLYGQSTEDAARCYMLSATTDITGEVQLRENTSEIGFNAFSGCSNPFTIKGLEHVISVGDCAFAGSGVSGDIEISTTAENALETLGQDAFSSCYGLTSVSIGYAKKCIVQENAFGNCYNLVSITFGENAEIISIRSFAFSNTGITQIKIPASVTSLSYLIFSMCTNLDAITFSGNVPPDLVGFSAHSQFYFTGFDEEHPGLIHVPEGMKQTYLDAWKYSIIGCGEADADTLSEKEKIEAQNAVRSLLGMELLEVPAEPEEEINLEEEQAPAVTQCRPEDIDPVVEEATASDAAAE